MAEADTDSREGDLWNRVTGLRPLRTPVHHPTEGGLPRMPLEILSEKRDSDEPALHDRGVWRIEDQL